LAFQIISKSVTVTEMLFTRLTLVQKVFVQNSYIEFLKNHTSELVAAARSQRNG